MANSFSTLRQLDINLSSSVYGDTTETETFCLMFNRLFDCFNARHLMEASQKANDDLKPYSTMDDIRLKVHVQCTCLLFYYCIIHVVARKWISQVFRQLGSICIVKRRHFNKRKGKVNFIQAD